MLDGVLEPKPVGVSAAVSYSIPVASCNLLYLAVEYNTFDPSAPLLPTDVVFDAVVSPLFAANPFNVTIVLGPLAWLVQDWFAVCRATGSFFQVWQWTSVALSAVGLVCIILRIVFLLKELKSPFNVPVLACGFAALAFFYQLLRDAVNPSNCYGTIYAWSSEIDGFLFTADGMFLFLLFLFGLFANLFFFQFLLFCLRYYW